MLFGPMQFKMGVTGLPGEGGGGDQTSLYLRLPPVGTYWWIQIWVYVTADMKKVPKIMSDWTRFFFG